MPKLPWYQFSVRSLLRLTVFVAVLCSIGVCTHWVFSVVIVTGGVVGGVFARTWLGFAQGAVSGSICSLIATIALRPMFVTLPFQEMFIIVAIIASVLGGVLGGYSAKYHSDG